MGRAMRRRAMPSLGFAIIGATIPHWTGPVWLATLPFMASTMRPAGRADDRRIAGVAGRAWAPTIIVLLIVYGAGLHYLSIGLPGLTYPMKYWGMSWRDLGRQVEATEHAIADETGSGPLVVGMDKYHLSSALAFYDPDHDGAGETAGIHLFGRESLMYRYWFAPERQEGRSLVLVGATLKDVTSEQVRAHVERWDPAREILVRRGAVVVGRYWSRAVHGYRSAPLRAILAEASDPY
jgi:dolichol-phosphate mannosyltransferase